MKRLEFELETVTPLFMAGADGKTLELRPPSIKGLMRFWWRAQYWGSHAGTKMLTSAKIEEKEGKIFGTASGNAQKSAFSIRLQLDENIKPSRTSFPPHPIQVISSRGRFAVNILDYLAYGVTEYQRGQGTVVVRDYLPPGKRFKIFLNISHHESDPKIVENVVKSFYLFSVFGGLGAKSRNGFGGVHITAVTEDDMVHTADKFFEQYKLEYPFPTHDVYKQLQIENPDMPEFTAFSRKMKIFQLKKPSCATWDECLAEIGTIYREARGDLERKHDFAKRKYLGAPLMEGKYNRAELERRAKPYFLRVVKGSYQGYILYLPSIYHDADDTKNFERVCEQFNKTLAIKMREVSL